MSIQYVDDYCLEENYINLTEEEEIEDIVSFNNIVYKDDILQMYLNNSFINSALR